MQPELTKIRTLIDEGNYADALEAVLSLGEFSPRSPHFAESAVIRIAALNGLGRWSEAIELASSSLDSLQAQGSLRELSTVHGMVGFAHLRKGSIRDAESHIRAAIHILVWNLKDPVSALGERRRLSLMFKNLGLWSQAQSEIQHALDIADQLGIARESGVMRINLAIVKIKSGQYSTVLGTLDEADQALGIARHTKWQMLSSLVRANFLRLTAHPASAMEILLPSLDKAREQKYTREEAITLEYIGDCYLTQREFKKALANYEAAFTIAEATAPEGDIIPELCHRMAEALIRLGDPNGAIVLCERGLRVARASRDRYEECATHRVYAMAHKAAGNTRKALRVADEGIELGRLCAIPYELGRTLAWAGEVRIEDAAPGEQAQGRQYLWEARVIFDRLRLSPWVRLIDSSLGFNSEEDASSDRSLEATELSGCDRGALKFGIITSNAQICEAIQILQSVAPSQIPVLITGESGVGKELLAQALHQMGPRRKAPFVPLNCGAISVNLLDSEFFGHERGSFTGAVTSREGLLATSDKGTLFLDEVADLPLQVQAALLRVLETGEVRAVGRDDVRKVDIRVVAATNAPLEDLVARGQFRQDLFYRLNGIRVMVPPLREREEDIKVLFRFFWSQLTSSAKKQLRLEDGVEGFLCAYNWPGNVRELRNEVARVVALAPQGALIGTEALLPQLKHRDVRSLRRDKEHRDVFSQEREQILVALRAHRGNKAEAARSLGGMKRTTLIYKIERFGIRPEEYQTKD